MSPVIGKQAQLIIASVLVGFGLMASYDFFRTLRVLVIHKSFFINLEDFVYWLYAGLVVFTFLYRENDGNLRGFMIFGVFCGMAVFNKYISQIWLKVLKKAVRYIKIKTSDLKRKKEVLRETDNNGKSKR